MAAFDPSKYERLRIVGEGSFGKCWLVRSRGTGKELIQKVIDLSKMTAEERSDTQREVEVLGKLRHPYVIRYRESFAEKNQFLSLIMDYASGGDLYSRIRRQKREVRKPFPEKLVLRWFTQICLAVKYIHDQKILHRDLKTQNIFLSFLSPGSGGASSGPPAGAAYGGSSHQQQLLAASNIKIGDFGIARTLSHTADVAKTAIGTPFYMSPEICQAKSYDYKSDIWACGCVLYEMSALKHAFDDESMKGLVLKILKGDFCREAVRRNYGGGRAPARVAQEQQEQKSGGAEDILELVEAALALDPRKRPMARDLLNRVVLRRQIFALLEEDKRRRNENNVPKAQDPVLERRPSLVVVEENESGRHGEGGAGGAGKSVETSVKSKHVVQRNAAGNPAAGAKVEQQKRRHRSEPVDHAPKPNIPQHKNFPAPPAAGPAAGDEAAQIQKQKQNVVRIGSRYGKRVSTSPRGMVVADAMNQGIVAGGGAGARQPAAAAPTVAHGGPPPRRRSEPQRQRQLERQVAVSSRIDAVALRLRQEDKAKAAASDTCYTNQARIRKDDKELKVSDPVEAARAEYLRRKSDLARYKSEKELAMAADHARRVPEAKGDLHRGERPLAVEPDVSSYVRAQVAAGGAGAGGAGGGKSAHGRRTSAGDGSSERVAIAARGGENKENGGVEGDSAARVSRLLAKVDELSQQYAHRRKALQHAREREKAAEDKSRQQKQRRQGAVVDLVEMEQKEQSKPEEDGERRFVSAQMRALATPHADAHAGKQDEKVEKVPKKRPYRSFLYQHHSPGSTGLLAKLVLGEAECTADAEAETAPAAHPAAGAGGETAPAHNAGDTQYVTAREGDLAERAAPVGMMTTPGAAAAEKTTDSGLEKTVALLLTSHEIGEGLEKTDLVERVKTPEMLAASTSSAGKAPNAKMKAVAVKEVDASAAKEEGARSKPAAQEQEAALVELYSGPSKATASTVTGTSGTTKTASPSAAQAAIARVLAKTHATDSVPYRLECVKAYLENEMGVGRLLFVYQLLAGRGGTTEGGTEEEKTLKITSKTMAFMPLVEQLRACENRFYEDQGIA